MQFQLILPYGTREYTTWILAIATKQKANKNTPFSASVHVSHSTPEAHEQPSGSIKYH
jgi:hypothetical protein